MDESTSLGHISISHANEITLRPRAILRIPVELWRIVFRYAIPDISPISIPRLSDLTFTFDERPRRQTATYICARKAAFQIKAAISRVCKFWREIVLEFLFDSIRLTCSDFEDKPLERLTNVKGAFRYIRSANVMVWERKPNLREAQHATLFRYLQPCTGLNAFQYWGYELPPIFSNTFFTECGGSLRYLDLTFDDEPREWDSSTAGMIPPYLLYLISTTAPLLEYFALRELNPEMEHVPCTVTLPFLHTLILRDCPKLNGVRWNTPRLFHVTLHRDFESLFNLEDFGEIPPHIRSLDLGDSSLESEDIIVDRFLELESLIIPLQHFVSDDLEVSRTNLRNLGVIWFPLDLAKEHGRLGSLTDRAEAMFITIHDLFLGLQHVRCWELDIREDPDSEVCAWQDLIEWCEDLGIRFDNGDGSPLIPPELMEDGDSEGGDAEGDGDAEDGSPENPQESDGNTESEGGSSEDSDQSEEDTGE